MKEQKIFQGYSDETFEFFMAIRFNNNREFFQDNRDWYLRAVREPSLLLAEALSDTVEDLDEDLDRRPYRVVSRINRDIRFARDKSPYRDCVWLAFRQPGERRTSTLGVFFDLNDAGASYGMGLYHENRALMNALRRQLEIEPEAFLKCYRPIKDEFVLYSSPNTRLRRPENLPKELENWYCAKGFYLEKPITDFEKIRSPLLADEMIQGYQRLKPLYRYLRALTPEEE